MSESAETPPIPARQLRNWQVALQQRMAPSYSPSFCQRGGAPRANRRLMWQEFRHSAALLVLPARSLGGNFATFVMEVVASGLLV